MNGGDSIQERLDLIKQDIKKTKPPSSSSLQRHFIVHSEDLVALLGYAVSSMRDKTEMLTSDSKTDNKNVNHEEVTESHTTENPEPSRTQNTNIKRQS